MADVKTGRTETSRGSTQTLAQRDRESSALQRRDPFYGGPFEWMGRLSEEMDRTFDRVFGDFGFPRRSWLSRGLFESPSGMTGWSPRVEAFQKGDKFIVRAELPGLKKDDVQVELTNDALTIHGERRAEHEEKREGYFHSERQYGQFHRTIALPEGVISESAQASFRDGILEVTMQAPPAEANRGRRLEIKDALETEHKK